jgi:Ni/Co efflux regulator RcnB
MTMKHVMTAALALTLMAGGSAFAQDRHDDRGGGPAPAAQPRARPQGDVQRGVPRNRAGQAIIQQQPAPQSQPQARRGGGDRPRDAGQPRFDAGQPGRGQQTFDRNRSGGGFRPRAGGFLDNRHWSLNQRFRGPDYRYPRGYGYQYWGFGAFLPGVFLTPDYALYNYWAYGLPVPPPGYHWIRVGPDALLVRYGDGYVLDAAYGLFY